MHAKHAELSIYSSLIRTYCRWTSLEIVSGSNLQLVSLNINPTLNTDICKQSIRVIILTSNCWNST